MDLAEKIEEWIREFIFALSIMVCIVGAFFVSMGATYFWLNDLDLGVVSSIVEDIGGWNSYILVIGVILLLTGLYYLYMYIKNRRFILEELETKKRSEFTKKHVDLENTVKHMPKKYRKMIEKKEKELGIK
ncbi:MAG: hypothetical protein V5A68_05875 [Candidatus Thermoplasmatota archaeon]